MRLQEELQAVRRDNSSLDSGLHERDKTVSHLTTQVAVLQQELKDKEQVSLLKATVCIHTHTHTHTHTHACSSMWFTFFYTHIEKLHIMCK